VPGPNPQEIQTHENAAILIAYRAESSETSAQDLGETVLGGRLAQASRDGDKRGTKEQPSPEVGSYPDKRSKQIQKPAHADLSYPQTDVWRK
jgi:hypothetical protein